MKKNLKDLLKLADFLDRLPPERFDYGVWGRRSECGTQACALGWAAQIPEFKKRGLSLKWYPIYDGVRTGHVVCGGYYGTLAGAYLFSIPPDDSRRIFSPDFDGGGEPTNDPGFVAMKIRNYVEAMK